MCSADNDDNNDKDGEVDTAILFDHLPKREKFRKAVSRLPKLGNFIFIK